MRRERFTDPANRRDPKDGRLQLVETIAQTTHSPGASKSRGAFVLRARLLR
jgi:hypothetical protein